MIKGAEILKYNEFNEQKTNNDLCKSALIVAFNTKSAIFSPKTKNYQTNPFSHNTKCPVFPSLSRPGNLPAASWLKLSPLIRLWRMACKTKYTRRNNPINLGKIFTESFSKLPHFSQFFLIFPHFFLIHYA